VNPSESCQCKSTFFRADACCKEQRGSPLVVHRVHIPTLVRVQQFFQPLVIGFLGGIPPRILVSEYQVSHHVGRCAGNILPLLSARSAFVRSPSTFTKISKPAASPHVDDHSTVSAVWNLVPFINDNILRRRWIVALRSPRAPSSRRPRCIVHLILCQSCCSCTAYRVWRLLGSFSS
jgi:hypothetical protein